jgi:Spy/CpxP family protein refolding chaperone
MKMFGTVGLAVAGALLAGTVVMAQGPGGGMGMGPGFGEHRPPMERALGPEGDHGRWWNNPKVVEQLKLTEEQRKAFNAILLEHREKLIDLRGNVEKAELEMEPLMSADQPNEARILSQIDKVAQSRAELEKANARFLLAIRSKLTPEQWKQMKAFRASHEQERGGWERGGPGRDGQQLNRQGPGAWKQGGPGQGGQHHHDAPPPPPVPQGAEPQEPADPGAAPQAPAAPGAGAEQ